MSLQFEITDSDGNALADISDIVSGKQATRLLNLMGTATGKVPSHLVGDAQGDGFPLLTKGRRRLKVRLDGTIWGNYILWNLQDDGQEDSAYTVFTACDPSVIWPLRPARDSDGDFSNPSFIKDLGTGPQIMQAILTNSESAGGGPPTDAEGPTFLDLLSGTVETSGADVTGAPTTWPMTIADVAKLLVDTGETDIVLTPLDTTDGLMAVFNAYNGDYGTDRTATVHFDYATGAFNAREMRVMEDMSTVCNKLWYYLGQKRGIQRWDGNITGDDPTLPDPPETAIAALIAASRSAFGVFMDIKVFGAQGIENSLRPLYQRLWQTESLLRVNGRTIVNVVPVRGLAPSFDIGDLITLNAGTSLRGGFSGYAQRVYGLTIGEDDDGVPEITNILDERRPAGVSKPIYHDSDEGKIGGLRGRATSLEHRPLPGSFTIKVFGDTAAVTVGDGAFILEVPADLDGTSLRVVSAFVTTVSSSGKPTVQIRNITQSNTDLLSTRVTIDAHETSSQTAAIPPVIDETVNRVAAGDLLAIDVDVAGTGAKGLGVHLGFS